MKGTVLAHERKTFKHAKRYRFASSIRETGANR
jgi:hypothetical protein